MQVDLENATFISNERLLDVMRRTSATPEQVAEAMRINTEARLRALKIGLLVMAGLALVAFFPAGRLPNYRPARCRRNRSRGIPSRSRKEHDGEAFSFHSLHCLPVSLTRVWRVIMMPSRSVRAAPHLEAAISVASARDSGLRCRVGDGQQGTTQWAA